jgi:5-methylcytosine-specific restriction enzyme subunit McrC
VTIPIRNLYYLFLYAWARFPGGSLVETGIDQSPDLPNMFAKLLSAGTRKLFRRGLDRGYKTFTDELLAPRGRLRLDRIIKEATQLRGTAICDFDGLTHNIILNQILKTTLTNLAASKDVHKELRHELRLLARQFYDVTDIRLSADCFRQATMSRNSRIYNFLMRICEFVFWSLMPDEHGRGARFQEILDDEVRMSAIFEEFLRNFYQVHRTEYHVRAERPEWCVSDATSHDLALLPHMLTDITLRHPDHTIIADAKFYRNALSQSPYGERLRSQHLYQLITYLQHERVHHPNKKLMGVLIYPEVGQSLRLHYRLLGIQVLVVTVDLGKQWQQIEMELNALVDECAKMASIAENLTASA